MGIENLDYQGWEYIFEGFALISFELDRMNIEPCKFPLIDNARPLSRPIFSLSCSFLHVNYFNSTVLIQESQIIY